MAERTQSVRTIFSGALDREDPGDRVAYLDAVCGHDQVLRTRVERLLNAHAKAGDFLELAPFAPDRFPQEVPLAEGPGTMIGCYKLLEKIGEGGMAVVYMAEQTEAVRRKVALKIIKLGMDTRQVIARFEAERQALAMMDHPNIAKVFDAGATETGRPYFVMELVQGVTITEYCDKNKLNTKDRLALFVQVCNAVQHAHQKGIIHRDIKPSNVMVAHHDGKPVPKVIDFGIAKAIDQRLTEKTLFTRYSYIIGTPAYMSPEQAELSDLGIDTRSDIYSLGVLLYELLTGTPPFSEEELRQAGYLEMQRVIRETEPTKPSTRLSTLGKTLTDVAERRRCTPDLLRKALRGDLDWIVMKSLEKDRTRRYPNVSMLLDDVQRHLHHEAVWAGPPGTWYRTKKFMQRHSTLVIATAVVTITVLAGLVVSITLYIQAEKARADTKATADFLTNDLLASVHPENVRGQEATVRYILANASAKLEGKFAESPLVEADIRTTLGLTYQKMGDYPAAEPHLKWALETRERILGSQHPDALQSMCDLAWQYVFQGRFHEAQELAFKALETGRRALGRENRAVLSAMNCCGFIYMIGFQTEKAEPLLHEGYEISRRTLGEEDETTISFMNQLAWLYDTQNRGDAAMKMATRVLELSRRVLGEEHPETIQATNLVGRVYTVEGRFDEAEALLRESIELSRRVLGDGHLLTVWYMARLASLFRAAKDHEREEDTTAQALEIARQIPGKLIVTGYLRWRLWQRVVALGADARAHYEAGRYDEAVNTLVRQEKLRRSLDYGHTELSPPDVAVLAMSLHGLQRDEEAWNALDRLREMLEQGEYTYEEQDLYEAEQLFTGKGSWAFEVWNLIAEGKLQEASGAIERSQRGTVQTDPAVREDTENLVKALARGYRVRGSRGEGRGEYEEAINDYEAAIETNPGDARAHARLARLLSVCHLAEWRDAVQGVAHATKACELTAWSHPDFISTLAGAHAEAGDFGTAVQLQRRAIGLLNGHERETLLADYERRLRLYEAGQPYHWSLIACWTFEQPNGKTVWDSSGNDLHGRIVGDALITVACNRQGKVLYLDGDGDWIDCGDDRMFSMASGLTIACWMNAEKFDKYNETLISTANNAWCLSRHLASNCLEFECSGVVVPDDVPFGCVKGSTDVNDTNWHHVIGVYDGTAMRLYVDGVLDATSEASGKIKGSPGRVVIGENDFERADYGRDRSFKGLIDDVRVYDYALGEKEIKALFAGVEIGSMRR